MFKNHTRMIVCSRKTKQKNMKTGIFTHYCMRLLSSFTSHKWEEPFSLSLSLPSLSLSLSLSLTHTHTHSLSLSLKLALASLRFSSSCFDELQGLFATEYTQDLHVQCNDIFTRDTETIPPYSFNYSEFHGFHGSEILPDQVKTKNRKSDLRIG